MSVSANASLSSPTKPQSSTKLAPSRANRLIIRNLPFDIKEEDIRTAFLPYGPIYSIDVPKTEDGGGKGFAFVWMMSKGDAQRALEKCNGTKLRAGSAEQFVQAKQKKKKQVRIEEKMSKEKARKEQEEAEEEVAGVERVIAVDWALSKDRWEEEKAKMEVDDDTEMGGDGSDEGEGSESEDDSGSRSGSDEEEDTGPEENSGDSSEEEVENPQKPQLPAPEAGTTLFVRNIPFEATEDEVRVLWVVSSLPHVLRQRSHDHAGSGDSVRSVTRASRWTTRRVDPGARVSSASGMSGTRTRWWKRAISCAGKRLNQLLRYSWLCTMECVLAALMRIDLQAKPNPFKLPSILTPDPSSSLAQSLVLYGRTLDVVRAVTRDEATRLKEEGERKREKADKRNMYLLREGGECGLTSPHLINRFTRIWDSDHGQLARGRFSVRRGAGETNKLVQRPSQSAQDQSLTLRVKNAAERATDTARRYRIYAETAGKLRDP